MDKAPNVKTQTHLFLNRKGKPIVNLNQNFGMEFIIFFQHLFLSCGQQAI